MTDWNKLERSETPLTSTVEMDEITEDLIRPFDYVSTGTEVFYPYLVPDDIPKDFLFDLVFIDAEHTNQAVFYDALKCYESMKNDSIIMMHDDWIVYKGIEDIENYLADTKQVFRKFKMPNCDITVIVIGNLINEFEVTFGTNCVSWAQFAHNAEKSLAIEIQKNKGNKK
jgi:hypothetical protein